MRLIQVVVGERQGEVQLSLLHDIHSSCVAMLDLTIKPGKQFSETSLQF